VVFLKKHINNGINLKVRQIFGKGTKPQYVLVAYVKRLIKEMKFGTTTKPFSTKQVGVG
jgi:hypothetical protein